MHLVHGESRRGVDHQQLAHNVLGTVRDAFPLILVKLVLGLRHLPTQRDRRVSPIYIYIYIYRYRYIDI